MIASGTTSTTPALRVAAPRAPRAPAHAQRPVRAAYRQPTDTSRNSASLYTAEKNTAPGKMASAHTASRAAGTPSSIAVRRCRSTSAPAKQATETSAPAISGSPVTAPAKRTSRG
jgi:hypothetical protein